MNRQRIFVLILLAAAVGLALLLRSCRPEEAAPVVQPAPAREAFHASRPIRVVMESTASEHARLSDTRWLTRELTYVLVRGRMRIAADTATDPDDNVFTLRIVVSDVPPHAAVSLVAADKTIERTTDIDLEPQSRLATLQAFARALPRFLDAAYSGADWSALIGTEDAGIYESYLRTTDELFGAKSPGFTHPQSQPYASTLSRAVERLESLTRRHPAFTRAGATLALGYLSLGGEDNASLVELAEVAARQALAADNGLAEARSALGLISLHRGEWDAALEHFDTVLGIDATSAAALEGMTCLLADVGHSSAAVPFGERAVRLQPASIGANECLILAKLAVAQPVGGAPGGAPRAIARVHSLAALLAGDAAAARKALRASSAPRDANAWFDPLLRAATDRRAVPEALRAITRAASDRTIDSSTELLCGVALREADFVFNRLLRLQRNDEPLPLRVLWLPQTAFLRNHERFEEIAEAAELQPFWQNHGGPEVCSTESDIAVCGHRDYGAEKRSE